MIVVIDTNVLVSAVLKDKNPEKVVLFIVERPDIEWIVSSEILAEYKEVLGRRKFCIPEDIKQTWSYMFESLTASIEVDIEMNFPRDEKDAKFLKCAIAANANYFITGDYDFKEAKKLMNTTILSVSQFKKVVCDVLS